MADAPPPRCGNPNCTGCPPAEPAPEPPADAAPTTAAPDGSTAILGRALLDRDGHTWPLDERSYAEEYYGPVREVLLVDPAAARVLAAARELRDASHAMGSQRPTPDSTDAPVARAQRLIAAERALAAAVDAAEAETQSALDPAAEPTTEAGPTLQGEFRREQWAAALRWAADLPGPAPDRAPGAILDDLANRIESGALTPWAGRQPDETCAAAHPRYGRCELSSDHDGLRHRTGTISWRAPWVDQPPGRCGTWEPELGPCIAERPCSVHDQPAEPPEPAPRRYARDDEQPCGAAHPEGGDPCRLLPHDPAAGHARPASGGFDIWTEAAPEPAVVPLADGVHWLGRVVADLQETEPGTCGYHWADWDDQGHNCNESAGHAEDHVCPCGAHWMPLDEPAPEPAGDGPGWERDIIEALANGQSAYELPPFLRDQLRALLADRDERERERDHSDAALEAAARDMAQVTIDRDAARAELAEVRELASRWKGQADALTEALAEVSAERDRYREHSVTLNTISWKIAEALGDVPEGADQVEGNPIEQTERLISQQAEELNAAMERANIARAERIRLQREFDTERDRLRADHLLIPKDGVVGYRVMAADGYLTVAPGDVEIVLRGDLGQEGGSDG